jgi:hypothetical protein
MGGFSRGETHGCVCRWGPVPLAVGHDLTYLLWNSSHLGSKHYSLSLLFSTNMLIRYIPWVPMSLFTTIMLICYLFAMGAYEGGCPCAASATDALWGGGCPCAHALLRYLVNN